MQKHELTCQQRKISGRKVKKLRKQGLIPGNIFGNKVTSQPIQLDAKSFSVLYSQIGESGLSYLQIEGEKEARPVFISQVTKHPVSGDFVHVVFHQVDLKQKVTAPVPVVLIGEPIAEKEKLGIMVQQLDEIEVEALPTNMPENIQVDVSGLDQVGSNLKVSDLNLDSTKLEVKTSPESLIVQIEALAKEEVAPVVATAAEGEPVPAATDASENPEPAKEVPAKE